MSAPFFGDKNNIFDLFDLQQQEGTPPKQMNNVIFDPCSNKAAAIFTPQGNGGRAWKH